MNGVSTLQPPQDLSAEGLRAFDVAVAQVAGFPDAERFFDAVVAFARSIDMLESVRSDWVAQGRPWVTCYSNGVEAVHPLVKLIRDLESDAHRARKALKLEPDAIKRAGPGRPPGAGSSADRVAPPVIRTASK